MTLGVIRVRGKKNVCKYTNSAPKGKRGKFCSCKGRITSKAKNTKRAKKRRKK